MSEAEIVVVGIGADGWAGLSVEAKSALADADVVFGGPRQLELVRVDAEKVPWPSPLLPHLDQLLEANAGRRVRVLASGDPMLSGIGTTLANRIGIDRLCILPAVSSVALARARMGWSAEATEIVSVVGRDVRRLARTLAPARQILVLSANADTPAEVARLLDAHGFGGSELTVLEELGGPAERLVTGHADTWAHPPGAALNILAIRCAADEWARGFSTVPGLPDEAFEHDGQLTKRDIRALSVAKLEPLPGGLLWDIGAGAGSVALEWSRTHAANRAIAVERDAARAARIERNAGQLGVPELRVVTGVAPDALSGLPTPDAVFVGGAVHSPAVLATCLEALPAGGRLVANAVTVEAERTLTAAQADHGGRLSRIAIEHAAPLGEFTGWTPNRSVTQWSVRKS